MASLVKQGKYYALIWTDSLKTKRQVWESLKTGEKDLAEIKKKELEWKFANGEHDPWERKWYEKKSPEIVNISKVLELYIKFKTSTKGRQQWSYNRSQSVKPVLHKFVKVIGDKPIATVSEDDLESFLFRKKVNSTQTRQSYRAMLITFFRWCVNKGYMKDYPDIELKPTKQKVPKFIYIDQLAKILQWKISKIEKYIKSKEAGKDNNQLWMVYAWVILASTGMRPSELVKIKLNHIGRGFIDIGEDFEVKNATERRIPLLFESKQAIDVLTRVRHLDRYMGKNDYLLGRYSEQAAKRLSTEFREGWDELFTEHRTLYNLKDTFAVRFLTDPHYENKQHRLYELQQILGHKSITSTEKYLKSIPYGVTLEGTVWDHFS